MISDHNPALIHLLLRVTMFADELTNTKALCGGWIHHNSAPVKNIIDVDLDCLSTTRLR